jgi:hypothetical protein
LLDAPARSSNCEHDRLCDGEGATLMVAVQNPMSAPMPGSLVVNLKPLK